MYWVCGTTTSSCATLSSTMCKMTNSTHQTTVSSRPLFSFGFFSCTILRLCSSIIPTLHHFVLTTPSFSFGRSWSTPKLCMCGIPRLTNSFLKFFAQALLDSPCMVVAHVLNYLPVCLFPLPFLWVAFPHFFGFSGTTSDLRHRPFILLVQLLRLTLLVWEHEDKPALAGVPDKSVNHQKHTVAEPLPKISSRRTQSPWLTLVHQLRLSVMLKNTPTKDFFFHTLVTIHTIGFTLFSWWRVLSSAIWSPWPNQKKTTGKWQKEMKRGKRWISCHEKHIETHNKKLFFCEKKQLKIDKISLLLPSPKKRWR